MSEIEKKQTEQISAEQNLTERINAEHRACEEAARSAVDHAIRCGEMLEEKKASLRHGEWLPWLEENFEGSRQTADAYRKLSVNRDQLNCQRVSNLSIRGALRELEPPEEPEQGSREPTTGGGTVAPALEPTTEQHKRPVDLPPSRIRDAFEEHVAYRDMSRTFAELVEDKKLLSSEDDLVLKESLLQMAVLGADVILPKGGEEADIMSAYLAMVDSILWGPTTFDAMIGAAVVQLCKIEDERDPNRKTPRVRRYEHSDDVDLSEWAALRHEAIQNTTTRPAGWLWGGFMVPRYSKEEEAESA